MFPPFRRVWRVSVAAATAGVSVSGAAAAAIAAGVLLTPAPQEGVLPPGLPLSCCCDVPEAAAVRVQARAVATSPAHSAQSLLDTPHNSEQDTDSPPPHPVIPTLRQVVGAAHVLTPAESSPGALAPYTTGARIGHGVALAVVRPGSLQEAVDVLRVCVEAGVAVLPQGANTGLTGGSVPRDTACDRPTVVLNMRRLDGITPLDGGKRLLCLAGAGISDVAAVADAHGRESHTVLGSQFLNPTVAAGVAFGSGGTQLRKGPVYTERALYCKVLADGTVSVVNTLAVKPAPGAPGSLLQSIQDGAVVEDAASEFAGAPASDVTYPAQVCTLDGNVSRYNADTNGLEVNRSEGKVLILATVHDTFPQPANLCHFWISCRDLRTAQALRREVFLRDPASLPKSIEYMDRDAFEVVDSAGRALCWALRVFGIGSTVNKLWASKLWVEALPVPGAATAVDKCLFFLGKVLPPALPKWCQERGKAWDHHLLVTLDACSGVGERLAQFTDNHADDVRTRAYDDDAERRQVSYFRFAAAPAFRTWCVGNGMQGVSVDYAMPKNAVDAPPTSSIAPAKRMRYSHFGCAVVHEDLAYSPHQDAHQAKMQVKAAVEACNGKLPAEHGHGTEYVAPPDTQARWKAMDPTNALNPGVGGLPYTARYVVGAASTARPPQ